MSAAGSETRTGASTSNLWTAAWEYAVDAWQRGVLYTDVMRQRGNQYYSHMAQDAPNVLSMEFELILDGRQLERPVNYGLLRILPPPEVEVDPIKRPFLVVDPRAGHGPGIGGFKPESEIGVAVREGHPCYFATFLPQPMPTQTVEDVMRAEARFMEEIIARHPEAEGKPVVVGNCQAGWQLIMTAAMRPELFGPIIIAGAPLSYWAGWRGKNPMRYTGGIVGGSWLTAFASDLGGGKFDGAWLVQNFENLNPANTLWNKQYNLYSKVDSEAPRYLDFEKWWGGHVFLNGQEIQYIVDNLFIGNRLTTADLVTSDGIRIDLRNIRSPIIVFCSKGDNITPPPQALGWIPDLYQNDEEVRAHGQTIVYAVHESIGHLGIFVSGTVARKEHQEFTSNIDMIDVLPPGIYQAEIADKTPETLNADLAPGDYLLSFERRKLRDVVALVQPIEEDNRRFAAVARISDINLGLYRSFIQPWLRAVVMPQVAEGIQRMHPLRLPYELLSDRNPWIASVAGIAAQVSAHRQPVAPDNPFLLAQEMVSRGIEASLDIWRELRDAATEQLFMTIYGSPLVQDWAGLGAKEGPARRHPGISPEHHRFMAQRSIELRSLMDVGGLREAAIRMLLYVSGAEGGIDERSLAMIRKMRAEDHTTSLEEFKNIIRDQALMIMLDGAAALQAMPKLLERASASEIRQSLADIKQVLEVAEPLSENARATLREMEAIFEAAAQRANSRPQEARPAARQKSRAKTRMAAEALPNHTALGARAKLVAKVSANKPMKKRSANKHDGTK
jgi:pimeloyl-ACP methyl ester carboxylesterase